MTLDEALSAAVLGDYVTHEGMQPGSYIYYNFNGWRIQFTHDGREGSSSGWLPSDLDKAADWYEFEPVKPNVGWGDFTPPSAPVKPGRKKRWTPPAEVNDIEDVKPPAQEGWAIFNGSGTS